MNGEDLYRNNWCDPASRPVNEHGSKARIGQSKSAYSDWRRTIGHGCYANDIDWLEWRIGPDATAYAVAIIETSFYEDIVDWRPKLPAYCAAALARFKRDAQYGITKWVAAQLDVPAYFVLAREDLGMFQVCRLDDEQWREMDEPTYRRWIIDLG